MSNTFRHRRLDRKRNEIRLLQVNADGKGFVDYQVQHYAIAVARPYRALSYQWEVMEREPGDRLEKNTAEYNINVNGCSLPIKKNLFSFLQVFCQKPREEFLWIDQITIDQSNLKERNHQVELMSKIYRRAFQVIIWLPFRDMYSWYEYDGRDPTKCQHECACISNPIFYEWEHHGGNPARPGWSIDGCKWTFELQTHSYWDRLWIIQEIVLARDVEVFYGQAVFDLAELKRLVEFDPANPDISGHWLLRNACRFAADDAKGFGFQELALAVMRAECSDDRDRVFSIQALLEDSNWIEVDYSKTRDQVFTEAALAYARDLWDRHDDMLQAPDDSSSQYKFPTHICTDDWSGSPTCSKASRSSKASSSEQIQDISYEDHAWILRGLSYEVCGPSDPPGLSRYAWQVLLELLQSFSRSIRVHVMRDLLKQCWDGIPMNMCIHGAIDIALSKAKSECLKTSAMDSRRFLWLADFF